MEIKLLSIILQVIQLVTSTLQTTLLQIGAYSGNRGTIQFTADNGSTLFAEMTGFIHNKWFINWKQVRLVE